MTAEERLTDRYYSALCEALEKLRGFGYEGDAREIEARYSLVYVEPRPAVRLSKEAPEDERSVERPRTN